MWQSNTIWANDNTLSMHKRSRESHDADTLRLPSYNYNNTSSTSNNNSSLSTTSSDDNSNVDNNHLPISPASTNTSFTAPKIELEFNNTSSHSLSNYMETTTSLSSESSSSSLISPSMTTRCSSSSSSSSYLLASSHVSLRTISNSSASSSSSVTAVATSLSSHPPASSPFRKLRGTSLHTRSLSRSSCSLKASFTIPSIPLPAAINYNDTTTITTNINNKSDNNNSKSSEKNDSITLNKNIQQNLCTSEKNVSSESRNKDHVNSLCKDDDGTTETTFAEEKRIEKIENSVAADIWSFLFSVDNVHLEKEKIQHSEKNEKDDTTNETSNVEKFLESTNKMKENEIAESTIDNHMPVEIDKGVFDESKKMTNDHITIDVHEENTKSSSNKKEVKEQLGYSNEEINESITSKSDHVEGMENKDLRREENTNTNDEHNEVDKTFEFITNDSSSIDNNIKFDVDGSIECAKLEADANNKLEENVNVVRLECNEYAKKEMINEIQKHAEVWNFIPGSLQTLNSLQQVTENSKNLPKMPEVEHFHDFVRQIIPCISSPPLFLTQNTNTNTFHLFQKKLLQKALRQHLFQTWKPEEESVMERLLSLVQHKANYSDRKSCKLLHRRSNTFLEKEAQLQYYEQQHENEAYNHTESFLVEWDNGTIGCTSDVLGLMHEEEIRQAHTYYLPPLPSSIYNKTIQCVVHNEEVVNDCKDDDDLFLDNCINKVTLEEVNAGSHVNKRKRRRLELKLNDYSLATSKDHINTINVSLCSVAQEQLSRLTWLHAERAAFIQAETHHSTSSIQSSHNYEFCEYYCNRRKKECNVPHAHNNNNNNNNNTNTKTKVQNEALYSKTTTITTPSFCECYRCCPVELNYVQIKLFPSSWYVYMSIWHQTNSIDDILINHFSNNCKDKSANRASKKRNRTNASVPHGINDYQTIKIKECEQENTLEREECNNGQKSNANNELEEYILVMFPHLKLVQCYKDNINNTLHSFAVSSKTQTIQTQLAHDVFEELTLFALTPHNMPHQLKLLPFSHALAKLLQIELSKRIDVYIHHILPHCVEQIKENEMCTCNGELLHNLQSHYIECIMEIIYHDVPDRTWEIITRWWSWLREQSMNKVNAENQESHKYDNSLHEHVLKLHVEHVAKCHGAAVLERVSLQMVHFMLIALKFQLHRRLRVMYEIIRIQISPSLRTCNRTQLMQLRQWYAFTPSPQSLLNLMQTFTLLRSALRKTFAHVLRTRIDTNNIDGMGEYDVNNNKSNVKEAHDNIECRKVKTENEEENSKPHGNTFANNHKSEHSVYDKEKKIRTLSLAVHSNTNTVMNKATNCEKHHSINTNERLSSTSIEQSNKATYTIHEMMLVDNNYTHILTEHARNKHHKNCTTNNTNNRDDINMTCAKLCTKNKNKENVVSNNDASNNNNNNITFEDGTLKLVLKFIDKHQRTPTLEEMDVLVKPLATRKTRREHRRA